MRKSSIFITAGIVTCLFVFSLIYLSTLGIWGNKADNAQDTSSEVLSESTVTELTAEPTATPTPTPTPIPVFIPDADELQALPALADINCLTEGLTVEVSEEGYTLQWLPVDNADYYIFCVSYGDGEFSPVQILSGDVLDWQYTEFDIVAFLIVAYADNEVEGTDDDELLSAYLYELILPTPTPTTKPKPNTTATPTPSPTPKPPNKYMIIVDKADCAFAVFTYDENGDYTDKVATYPACLGTGSKTPVNTFAIGKKDAWHAWNGGSYSPFTSRYAYYNGTNLYFHGPVYYSMSWGDMKVLSYEQIGTYASGGCVRTTVRAARFVYYNCAAGTVVKIVSSSDLVSYPGKTPINPDYPTWDPTDPNLPTPTQTPTPTPTLTSTPSTAPTTAATSSSSESSGE